MPTGPTREELAWAAGFFDGEGSFYFHSNGKTRNLTAQVTQAYDTEVLETFLETVRIGKIYSKKVGENQGPQWRWEVYGFEKVQFTAVVLWPWLGSVKREQYIDTLMKWRKFK